MPQDNLDATKVEETPVSNPPTEAPKTTVENTPEVIPPVEKPEEVVLTKEEYERLKKREEDAENYKRENQKYRVKNLDKPQPVKEEAPIVSEPVVSYEDQRAIETSFYKDKQDIVDTIINDFNVVASDDQWNKFTELFPAVNTHLIKALQEGKFVSRAKIEKTIKEYINYAKGIDKSAIERSRAEGAMEAINAEKADIGSMNSATIKRSGNVGVLPEDEKYSLDSGNIVTPQEAKQIRESREARRKEYEPRIAGNEIE